MQQNKTQPNVYKPCEYKYLCQKLREGKCSLHTEQHKTYAEIRKFLSEIFTGKQKKLLLGKVQTIEGNGRFQLIPCKKEMIQQFPQLCFHIIEDTEIETLSEEFYYEAQYEEKDDKNGKFYVKLIRKWGTIGEARDDIEALFYGQEPIYEDFKKFPGYLRQGLFKEKRNGEKVVKCGNLKYPVLTEKDQNRAFSGNTVKFREVKRCAQIVSIVKNPLEEDYIYGILEASSDRNKQICMEHLYCPVPDDVNWGSLEDIFGKTGERFATSFKNSMITRRDFQDKYAVILQVKPEDSKLLHLTDLIFYQKTKDSLEICQAKKIWESLYQLVNRQKEMKQARGNYYFKPLNKDLPIFQCMPIEEDLLNPEIWRSYVRVKYAGWPAASKHPWVMIEGSEGLIGDSETDIRVILKRNHVITDWFSKEIQKDEKELLKAWDKGIEETVENCEKLEEKVFTIDKESTRSRDDGFSLKKLADGKSFEIGIHIADVTRVVEDETEIYKEAKRRFHSCYIGGGKDFFRPMLPKKLGQHLSLNQNQWKYAFSVFILMDKEGAIDLEKTRFQHMMINPAKNFTYEQADQIIDSRNAAEDEVNEAVLLMNELGVKLGERRQKLGCKIEIDEEDSEKSSQSKKMVEEFMILANEIATDFVKHQEEALGNKLLKIRNEEKKIERESIEERKEEKMKAKEEKAAIEDKEKSSEEEEEKEEKEDSQKKMEKEKKQIVYEDEEEEEEEENISEDEKEVDVKRRDSESEEKSQAESDVSLENERKMRENDAIKACNFLISIWENAIDQKLDLTDKQAFLKSQRWIKESQTLKSSLKQYLQLLLKLNNQSIELVLKKKLPVKNSQDQEEESHSETQEHKERKKIVKEEKVSEKEDFPALGESLSVSANKSSLEDLGLKFAVKQIKSKQKKKAKQQPSHFCEEDQELKLLPSPEVIEKISANNEEVPDIEIKKELEDVVQNEETAIKSQENFAIEPQKEEPKKFEVESPVEETSDPSQEEIVENDKEKKEEEMIESEREEEGFSVKQSERIMQRYDRLENSQKMKFTSPIRRFHDILVHELINEILQIEEEISKINETIQEKLAEQERKTEDEGEKKKKIKTRYQIFQALDSELKDRISELEKLRKKMRVYDEQNSSNKKGGMSRAEREKKNMEVCKSVISGQESILADAIVTGIYSDRKIEVFLLKHSFICTLNCVRTETFGGQKANIYFADKSAIEVRIYQDIKVEVSVKKTFPLEFDVSYYKKK